MPVRLGIAARELRNSLELSLRDAASELGVSYTHLCNVENEKAVPSPDLIEKFHDTWGIDLYMYALAFHSDDRVSPPAIAKALKPLAAVWREHIKVLIRARAKERSDSCSTSAD